MQKENTEEHTLIDDEVDAKIWTERIRGDRDRIEVHLYFQDSDEPHQRYSFKIEDEHDKTAYYVPTQGRPDPSHLALVALAEYGFDCTSHDLESPSGRDKSDALYSADTLDKSAVAFWVMRDQDYIDDPVKHELIERARMNVEVLSTLLELEAAVPDETLSEVGIDRERIERVAEHAFDEDAMARRFQELVVPLFERHYMIEEHG